MWRAWTCGRQKVHISFLRVRGTSSAVCYYVVNRKYYVLKFLQDVKVICEVESMKEIFKVFV